MKLTKAVVLAGGFGARLDPLTKGVLNKHLISVHDRPMIYHVIENLVASGIADVLVLLNGPNTQLILEHLEDGRQFGVTITYRYARSAHGPGRALLLAEPWVGDDPFLVVLGDTILFRALPLAGIESPSMFVSEFEDGFDDLSKYGQVELDEREGRVTKITWKPPVRRSRIIQVTAFVFGKDAFSRLHRLDRETLGEVPITALTSEYVEEGLMRYRDLGANASLDCGTLPALWKASSLLAQRAS